MLSVETIRLVESLLHNERCQHKSEPESQYSAEIKQALAELADLERLAELFEKAIHQ